MLGIGSLEFREKYIGGFDNFLMNGWIYERFIYVFDF